MKGIVFTEFLEMVEAKFGYSMVDKIIVESNLPRNGAYTSVGTYPHQEMVGLLIALQKETKLNIDTLLKSFGSHIFQVFKNSYASFFEHYTTVFEMLEGIDQQIHVEVKKLYPDAELPKFETERIDTNTLRMVYYSERRMAAMAEGMIASTLEHFGEKGTIELNNLNKDGSIVEFIVKKHD